MSWQDQFLKAFGEGIKAALKYFKSPGGRKHLAKAAEQVQKNLKPVADEAIKVAAKIAKR